ncbi:unnamed protein product [Auanema sp. JU1783]|nr:unnamed protein product [Auanema sp. JU1783]
MAATTTTSSTTSSKPSTTVRCRCCPYGFHIDLGFVQFAEEVAKGNSVKRTPTLSRRGHNGERNLMSPLDSLFSDSMENLVSDLEEVLNERPDKPKAQLEIIKDRLQNGYVSDYTVYRSKPSLTPSFSNNSNKTFALDFSSAPPKPPHRGATPISSLTNGRSTPSGYATALGRTISEIKARNTESPIPDRTMGSRVGTPIDLGIPTIQNGRQTPPVRRNDSEYKMSYEVHVDRPSTLCNTASSPAWRRPLHSEILTNDSEKSTVMDFASLRRGREQHIPDSEPTTQNRIRYYSASPKLSRKLLPVPNNNPSQFTYAQQNGHTILAKSQGTCTSPISDEEQKIVERPAIKKLPDYRSIATSTGPLPPAKPCSECPVIKAELKDALLRVPPPKPLTLHVCTETDVIEPEPKPATVDKCTSMVISVLSIGTDPDKVETRSTACSPIIFETTSINTQTDCKVSVDVGIHVIPSSIEFGMQTEFLDNLSHSATNTDAFESSPESKEGIEKETMTTRVYYRNFHSQTDDSLPEAVLLTKELTSSQSSPSSSSETASQTDCDQDSSEARALEEAEMNESIWLMSSKETNEIAVGPDEIYEDEVKMPLDCIECLKRDQVFSRNVGVGNCSVIDKVCVTCDNSSDEVNENDISDNDNENDKPKQIGSEQVASLKKLLTSDQKQNFVRGTVASRSARMERKKTDELEYVEQQNKDVSGSASSTPTEKTSEALKNKVILKKDIPPPPSVVPEPVPARIPRPKISKYAVPDESAETPDEADEATDRLTPLRSELRSLGRWPRSPQIIYGTPPRIEDNETDDEEDEAAAIESDNSEGSYDTNEDQHVEGTPFEITAPLREALESLNSHLLQPGSVTSETADWALKYVQHEWLKTSARKCSKTNHVDVFIEQLKELSPLLLKTVINISDQNGNTALHYSVSHGNFGIVSSLLDTHESQLNMANRAGYSPVMLAALSNLEDDVEKTVVQRVFEMGNVNAKATQHGQTALMLAVSHGKKATTELLLVCGADVNIQDEEGSTALMCAAEHGHKELVKLLLAQPSTNASLADCDSSTALSIAVENGHRDIGVLIYAHINYKIAEEFQDL